MRFILNIPLSSYVICQLVEKSYSNTWDNYIQAMLRGSKQLVTKVHYLKLKNKGLMKALKTERKKSNKGKRPNLLSKKDDGLQLFSSSRVQTTCNFVYHKEVKKEK